MDGDGKNPVFRSDNINASKNSKHNYFVNIIKNPILRFFLRQSPLSLSPLLLRKRQSLRQLQSQSRKKLLSSALLFV